jgi:hypothetical protein
MATPHPTGKGLPPSAPPPSSGDEWMLPLVPLVLALLEIGLWIVRRSPMSAEPQVAIAIAAICSLVLGRQAVLALRRKKEKRSDDA